MPHRSSGFGSKPSVVSSTVLSPVSGSAGFRSSVFLSSCAAAEPADRRLTSSRGNHRRIGLHGDCRFGDTLAAFGGPDNNAVSPKLEYESEHKETPRALAAFCARFARNQTEGHRII